MIVKLRKGKKLKNFKNNHKFQQNLAKIQDFRIFKTISLSQETIQYHFFKLTSFNGSKTSIIFQHDNNFSKKNLLKKC